jgi:hypothetical protein
LLIEEGSMSMWIFFEPGENASVRPVIRSSKRAPDAHHDVALVHGQVGLVGAVHAEHAEPLRVRTPGTRPSPISVEVTGKPVTRASSRNSRLASGPELITPPPV